MIEYTTVEGKPAWVYRGDNMVKVLFDDGTVWFGLGAVRKYDPNQPRAPKGDPKGGQWVKDAYPNYDDGLGYDGDDASKPESLSEKKAQELYEQGGGALLSMGDKQELSQWAGDSYDVVNGFLRGTSKSPGNPIGDRYWNDANKSHLKWMDSVFSKVSLPENITVYRGVSPSTWNKLALAEGAEFSDIGFMSTSLRLGKAITSSGGLNEHRPYDEGRVLEIRLPKGAKAIAINGHATPSFRGEAEVLVNRGARFRVVSVSGTRAVLEYVL